MLITIENEAINFLKNQLDDKAFESLNFYREILSEKSKLFNLISKNTIDQIWQRHILDSYQLINYIDKDDIVIDIGSGAGLPGIILAILGVKNITMIDSINKKVKFINETIENLSIDNAHISAIHSRIEDLYMVTDILTARALKPLNEILFLIEKNIIVNKKILLLKGSKILEEIEEAEKFWNFEYKLHKSMTSPDSFIIEISGKVTYNLSRN